MNIYTSYTDALGFSHKDEVIATYENGKVYMAVDGFLGTVAKGEIIGEYENGQIYSVSPCTKQREYLIGTYENGYVYGVYNTVTGGVSKTLCVGECANGNIYSKKDGVVGKYDGDVNGAAAAAAILLFKLTSKVYASQEKSGLLDSEKVETETKNNEMIGMPGCSGYGIIFGLFLICLVGMILYEYKEYMTLLFYVAIPVVILLYSILKKRKVLQEKGFKITKYSIMSMIVSFALTFIYVLFTVGIFMHRIGNVQIFNMDAAILIAFVVNMITAIINTEE